MTTTYITLGLLRQDGTPVFPDYHVDSVHGFAGDALREDLRGFQERWPDLQVHTFAVGTGTDEHGNTEPCAIWALGLTANDRTWATDVAAARGRLIARHLAEKYDQRCVVVTVGEPQFVAPRKAATVGA